MQALTAHIFQTTSQVKQDVRSVPCTNTRPHTCHTFLSQGTQYSHKFKSSVTAPVGSSVLLILFIMKVFYNDIELLDSDNEPRYRTSFFPLLCAEQKGRKPISAQLSFLLVSEWRSCAAGYFVVVPVFTHNFHRGVNIRMLKKTHSVGIPLHYNL